MSVEVEQARWQAVERRDRTLAGSFVYAVRTTGIYCRPGCGARRPLRRNVAFFDNPVEAEKHGYRACKRCRPMHPKDIDESGVAVAVVCRAVADPHGEHDVAALARALGWSERHLRRRFLALVGVSIGTYRRSRQADSARAALAAGATVTEAWCQAGYGSARGFYDHGARQLGMRASHYRQGGHDVHLVYTTVRTPIGTVLAARGPRGICAVRIGDDPSSLARELAGELPGSTLERDDAGMRDVAEAMLAAASGDTSKACRLPVDLVGSAFQARVWDALRSIPSGQTRTYGEMAAGLGAPGAARAVGSACGANPAALVVPCHRVVRSDGTSGGYRWGSATKAALLAAEAARNRGRPAAGGVDEETPS